MSVQEQLVVDLVIMQQSFKPGFSEWKVAQTAQLTSCSPAGAESLPKFENLEKAVNRCMFDTMLACLKRGVTGPVMAPGHYYRGTVYQGPLYR